MLYICGVYWRPPDFIDPWRCFFLSSKRLLFIKRLKSPNRPTRYEWTRKISHWIFLQLLKDLHWKSSWNIRQPSIICLMSVWAAWLGGQGCWFDYFYQTPFSKQLEICKDSQTESCFCLWMNARFTHSIRCVPIVCWIWSLPLLFSRTNVCSPTRTNSDWIGDKPTSDGQQLTKIWRNGKLSTYLCHTSFHQWHNQACYTYVSNLVHPAEQL